MPETLIQNVSDTALWVAAYRAAESKRPDALFHDPLAERLSGERGRQIGASSEVSPYVAWLVVIRTVIIDRLIQEKIQEGIELVLNLGTGLDTRPYRMELPPTLTWIEVDFPKMIEAKARALASETPRCKLERMKVDLSNPETSQKCFADIAARSKKILVLTEGVIPYLTNPQVAALGTNLIRHESYRYWIAEYLSTFSLKMLHKRSRTGFMKNSPFQFYPESWNDFFKALGWIPQKTIYLAEESLRLGRAVPTRWWVKIIIKLSSKKKVAESLKFSGFTLFERQK